MLFQQPARTIKPGYLIPIYSLDAPKAIRDFEMNFKYFTFIFLWVISGLFPQLPLARAVPHGRK